jgi:selenium-binding protein 1
MESPAERYAYVAALAPDSESRSDALLVIDVDASSGSYGRIVGQLDLPNRGDELHHFGWNSGQLERLTETSEPSLRTKQRIC